jgi:hypothetical protein
MGGKEAHNEVGKNGGKDCCFDDYNSSRLDDRRTRHKCNATSKVVNFQSNMVGASPVSEAPTQMI